MFKRLDHRSESAISITFDGGEIAAVDGENLAVALLAAGISTTRDSPVSGRPRAPYCMMGACYDCLVRIEGRTVQACMFAASDGLVVERPAGILGHRDKLGQQVDPQMEPAKAPDEAAK